MNIAELETKTLTDLQEIARTMGVTGYTRLKKNDLIMRLLRADTEAQGLIFGGGTLEVIQDGIGFLRANKQMVPGPEDVYISQSQIRRFGLRTGDFVVGQVRPPKESEKYYGLLKVEAVNGVDPEVAKRRPKFEDLTPIFPNQQLNLETHPSILTTRLIDMVAPIGRGQRGLIVSPPKAGKTTVLKQIANGISENFQDVVLMVLLIGERPEEVTDMDRAVEAEVLASTFDEPVQSHVRVAEMGLERAKRLVEAGRDVAILLDSITRLTRAYNLTVPASGRTLSGGIDPRALYPPQALLRRRPQDRGRRQPDDHRDLPRGHRQPHGRCHLRGVQGHRQHGAPPGPPPCGAPHLPRSTSCVPAPTRGTAARLGDARQGLDAAPDDRHAAADGRGSASNRCWSGCAGRATTRCSSTRCHRACSFCSSDFQDLRGCAQGGFIVRQVNPPGN